MKQFFLKLTLRCWGWRPCKLPNGLPGWRKAVSPKVTRVGPLSYASRHLTEIPEDR